MGSKDVQQYFFQGIDTANLIIATSVYLKQFWYDKTWKSTMLC